MFSTATALFFSHIQLLSLFFIGASLAEASLDNSQYTSRLENFESLKSRNYCGLNPQLDRISNRLQWTYEPYCVRSSHGENDADRDVCLFTNTHFRFGRGISFVTTPEIAIEITRSYEFSDYERLPPSEPPPYRAEELLGRGIGLLANRTIKSGETVMGNPPVIVLMQKALDTLEREQRYALLHKAVGQLPEQTQTQIRALAKSRGGDEIGDIVQTNSIGQSYGKGVRHLSIVPEAARINHDCRPNSFYRFDDKDLTLQVFALRNIEAGEEISFNYAGAEFPRDARHSYLQAHWGFTCACSLCTASHQAIAASDSRLNEISNIKAQLRNTPPRSTASLHEILSLVQKLIELYDEERLIVPKAPYYEIAAYTCSQLGNKTCVQRNAELAADHWRVLAGEKSWEVTRMLGLGGNPKAHPSWRTGVGS